MPPRARSNGVKRKYDEDENSDGASSASSPLSSAASEYDEKPKLLKAKPRAKAAPKSKKVKSEEGEPSPSKPAKSRKTTTTTTAKGKAKAKAKASTSNSSEAEDDSDAPSSPPSKPKTKASRAKAKAAAAPPRPPRTGTQSASSRTAALEWLLSDEAYELANPFPRSPVKPSKSKNASIKTSPYFSFKNEQEENEKKRLELGLFRYPHSKQTPFQCLLSALLLSKPLSHKLGIRTICTLFNEPFLFGKYENLEEADEERRLESLWVARTQHKDKTAIQMGDLVDGVRGLNGEGEEDSLGGIRRAIQGLGTFEAQERTGHMLRSIKGIGPIGVGVFLRRIQEDWPEVFPFADNRCLNDARAFGLITERQGPRELSELVEGDRQRFVKLLDTLIGLDLERKLDECVDKFW
ncbi:hypothetical protein CI109_100948 [Kwoniella shandongensis]|uniref:Uncharacterized protein n=1 Tax=Kwoniella shandongensis TaxID=1734106 RepID=A0A5M6C5G7_9TREE|nr:uncharacterized protein CI109_001414 [Kwoniella shandongensis]KAA5530011.1 hypothetical protein CI109_001414 [Kwoniella shandongensis]